MQHLYPFKMCIIHNFFAGGVSPLPCSAISPYFIIRPLLRRSIHLYLNYSLFTILYSLKQPAAEPQLRRGRANTFYCSEPSRSTSWRGKSSSVLF